MGLTVDLWIRRYGCETKKAWLSGDHVLQFQLVEMNTATKVMTLLELWNQGLSNLSELSVGESVKSCMLLKTALATIFSNPLNAVQSYSRLVSVFVSCYGFVFFFVFFSLALQVFCFLAFLNGSSSMGEEFVEVQSFQFLWIRFSGNLPFKRKNSAETGNPSF